MTYKKLLFGVTLFVAITVLGSASAEEHGALVATLSGHRGPVGSLTVCPKRQLLCSGCFYGDIILWDLSKKCKLIQLGPVGRIASVAISPDAKFIVSGSAHGDLRVWDVQRKKEIERFKAQKRTIAVAMSPDGTRLATGSADQAAIIWSFPRCRKLRQIGGRGDDVDSITFSPDGMTLATARRTRVKVWSSKTGQKLAELKHQHLVGGIDFSPDGKILAIATAREGFRSSGTIVFWDTKTWKETGTTIDAHKARTLCLGFSSDGKLLASGSWVPPCGEGQFCVWEVATKKCLIRVSAHSEPVESIRFVLDDQFLITGSSDKNIKVWSVPKLLQNSCGQYTLM